MVDFRGLLEYGCNAPTAFFAVNANMDAARLAPIDGTVIRVETDGGVELSVNTFSGVAYTIADLDDALSDMSIANCYGWGKLQYRFIKTHCSSLSGVFIDPFDASFSTVITNYKLLGRFAALTGCGLNFDGEAYMAGLWTYDDQPLKASHTIEEYQDRWYEIGLELGEYWRQQDPDMLVLLFHSYEVAANSNDPPETNASWLYNWFLNGLFDSYAAQLRPNSNTEFYDSRLIPTSETSYLCRDEECIEQRSTQILGTAGRDYRGQSKWFGTIISQPGLATWLDRTPFDPATPEANYFTPSTIRTVLNEIADRVPWAWTYNPDYAYFNVESPRPIGLIPQAYLDEINEFRRLRNMPVGDDY